MLGLFSYRSPLSAIRSLPSLTSSGLPHSSTARTRCVLEHGTKQPYPRHVCGRIIPDMSCHTRARTIGTTSLAIPPGPSQSTTDDENDDPDKLKARKPQIPLCERPAMHTAKLSDLLAWRERAEQHAITIGSSWTNDPDAPSLEDLRTELSWLLEDVVAENLHERNRWKQLEQMNVPATWNSDSGKSIGGTRDDGDAEVVTLRATLETLDNIWMRRINNREPLQYLTSCAFWRDLILSVGPGVLIPRPETELVVDFAVDAVKENPNLGNGPWADLGTGSGALAIGIATAIPSIPRVWAVDLAPEPVAYATFNAARAGVKERVQIVQGSWYEPLRNRHDVQRLSGIVSNPPYITSDLLETLQAEVGLHEPALALEGGEGLGIDSLTPICIGAVDMLCSGGFLAIETAGGEQADYIGQLLRHLRCLPETDFPDSGSEETESELAFENVRVRCDLRGVNRFVTAIRR